MLIFTLSGEAQNGKDSVADIMMKKLRGRSIKIAMADYLKFIATKYYGWDGEKDERGRTLLQELGTEKIRVELGWDTFHAERVCQDIKIIQDLYDYVFIPDARFVNEIRYTQAKFPHKVVTIHVTREDFVSPLTKEQQNHKSERDLDDFQFDYYISSGSGLDVLERQVDETFEKVIRNLNMRKFFTQYASY